DLGDPEDPAGVPAGGARLSAKAGRKATVTQRQLSFGKKVVRVQSCQAHLRGTDQVEVVVRHFIYLRAVGRQEAGPEERLLAYEYGRNDGDEPLRLERLERELDERQLDAHEVALEVGEAGAGSARRAF